MLTAPDQSSDTEAPASQFFPKDGERLWNEARARAAQALPEQGAGFFSVAERLPDGFRVARWFESENFNQELASSSMKMAITAERAERIDSAIPGKTDSHLLLEGMRLTYFLAKASPSTPKEGETKSNEPSKSGSGKEAPKAHEKLPAPPGASMFADVLPNGGRVLIRAPRADIDINTNEGRATGGVTIEVFPEPEPGKEPVAIAILQSERLNWRTWSEPSIGSQELAAYTSGADQDSSLPDPVVSGTFNIPQPDGSIATTRVEGRGLVYEIGVVDHLEHVYDEEGREAGLSRTAHNHAFFHRQIKLVTTATSMRGILPFQGADKPGTEKSEKEKESEKKPPKPQKEEAPSKTVIVCEGPATFDLAALPRSKATGNFKAQKTPLSQRYDFLNRVMLTKVPLDPATGEESKTEKPTEMSCMHLCMQYPPGVLPGPGTFPDYSEAIGGVTMHGMSTPAPVEGLPPPVPTPVRLNCDRLFLDGASDNIYLVGTQQTPAYVLNGNREATAQQFAVRTKTQSMTMPTRGPKKLVLRPDPNAAVPPGPNGEPPKASGINLSTSETIITWHGTLSREIKHIPVPSQPDIEKEVLTFKDDVLIEIPQSGTRFRGDMVRIVRLLPEGDLEFLEGTGNVNAVMDQTQAIGEIVTMDLAHDKNGNPTRNITTVIGSRKLETKATLIGNGSSVRADKFIVDNLANTLESFGGAVAMVRMEPPKPTAAGPMTNPATGTSGAPAGGNSLFKNMSFDMSAPVWIQCEGEFSKASDGRITTRKNVLIRQPGKQLIADEVFFDFEQPPPPAPNPAQPNAPPPPPDNSLISGELSRITCNGLVELTSDEQVLHCDHLINNVKTEIAQMFMDDPENDVRIYKMNSDKTQVISVLKSLGYDGKTGLLKPSTDLIKPAGQAEPSPNLLILPYREKLPAPRDKESSPRRPKKAPATQVKP